MADEPRCPACRRLNPPVAKFCVECGAALSASCGRCGAPLRGYEKWCTNCGQRLADTADPPRRACSDCVHFREAVTLSTRLRVSSAAAEVADALVKIKEEEVKLRDEEANVQVDRLKVGGRDWGLKPVMHAYCGEHEDEGLYELHEVKNRDGHCASFTPRLPSRPTECVRCLHRSVPPDPVRSRCNQIHDPQRYASCVDAVHKQCALEVLDGWIHKGLLPYPPAHQNSCLAYSGGGQYALCDYFNCRGICPRYDPIEPVPAHPAAR